MKSKTSVLTRTRVISGVVITLLFLFPIFWMILTSFKQQVDIFTSPPKLFFSPTLSTYKEYLHRSDVSGRLLNTVIIAVSAGLLSTIAGAMAGYAVSRIKAKGMWLIGILILLSRGVPPIALAVPLFLVSRKLGLSDKHITLILAYCTFLIPYVMWLMRGFFISIPKEMEEAALVDGCSRYGAFFKIIIPISIPSLISTFIFSIILAWNELLFALVLTSRYASTIPVAIASLAGDTEKGADWAALTAVGTVTVIPVIIFALLVQKWLIQGLAEGATKG